jgi:MFS transporter, UMF1 family
VFVTPLFLFTPDVRVHARRWPGGRGLASPASKPRSSSAGAHRDACSSSLANMIYADGLIALFAFGGIYAAGVFGWRTTEIGIFGILLTITGTIGAFAGGRLDDRLGPKRSCSGALGARAVVRRHCLARSGRRCSW